ncbi:MAG: LysR family transcriptional regulator [Solirubrobacterales bacterium]|nr:LysR family transcriptional regulator [Solirubrobacterales bacterium]
MTVSGILDRRCLKSPRPLTWSRVRSAPTVVSDGALMPFRPGHLEYFVAVAEEGQISRAALKLHVAQPALSTAIANLESQLGVQLLERHPRGVTLTHAGEIFLEKARAALATAEDAILTAESLARADHGTIVFGYLGLPPAYTNQDLIAAFTEACPDIELSLRELAFPSLPTASWLRDVDAAICTRPAPDPNVRFQPLRAEPRVVLIPNDHPLAQRRELAVADVLDETFLGFDPSIDPAWAGFWSLDDHRGRPPARLISDHVNTPQQRFATLAAGCGVATAPACHAAAIANALPNIVAIPLTDAEPATLTLLAHIDRHNPVVEALFTTARQVTTQVTEE